MQLYHFIEELVKLLSNNESLRIWPNTLEVVELDQIMVGCWTLKWDGTDIRFACYLRTRGVKDTCVVLSLKAKDRESWVRKNSNSILWLVVNSLCKSDQDFLLDLFWAILLDSVYIFPSYRKSHNITKYCLWLLVQTLFWSLSSCQFQWMTIT